MFLYYNSIMRITRRSLSFFLVVIIGRGGPAVQQVEKKRDPLLFRLVLRIVNLQLDFLSFSSRSSVIIYISYMAPDQVMYHTQLGLIKIRFDTAAAAAL